MLILAMSFSGSVVFLAILLCAVLGKRVCAPSWIYNMLRLDLIFFCLPLPKYNSEFRYRLFRTLGIQRKWSAADVAAENVIGIEGSGRLHFSFQAYILVIWAVWLCGLLFVSIRNMYFYRKVNALKENPRVSLSNYLTIFDRVKKEVGIKKSVILLCDDKFDMICTIGVFRKYVVITEKGLTEEEIYYSLKHELVHVKRSDVAWRYLSLLAVLLHWFNPLAYLYFYVMTVYCEQSCDAIVVKDFDKAERKKYGRLIISLAQVDRLGKWKYQTHLSGSKKMIERRLINMLESGKKKRTERVVSLLLGAVILFGGSLTVCAYENPQVIKVEENDFFETFQDDQRIEEFVAEEIGHSEVEALKFAEFLGDDGSCYVLSDAESDNIERAGCIHAYVSGHYKVHYKNDDGSCKTDYYYAQRCDKCGRIEVKEYSHTETSTKCTH